MSGRDGGEARDGKEARDGGRGSDGHPGELISRWEWLTATLGLLLLLVAVGFLAYEAATGDELPPSVVVAMDSVTTANDIHQVHFTVRNEGGRAGASVLVEGRLTGTGGEEETSEATLDYVPGRSRRAGGLFFRSDPRRGRLELRVHGYSEP